MDRSCTEYRDRVGAAAKVVYSEDALDSKHSLDFDLLGIKATLKPHQIDGVSWLLRRYMVGVNVILGDEMGLGKTLQAICLLTYLKIKKISAGPFLVLCPLSTTDGWVSEITTFSPMLSVMRYVGDKEHRRNLRKLIHEQVNERTTTDSAISPQENVLPFDVFLTTYDVALIDQDFLSQIPWKYAIIDEAHRLKNSSSVLYNVLKDRFVMPRRLLLTGTPIQNNLTELWALLHFCMPSVFGTKEQFLSEFQEVSDNLSVKYRKRFKGLRFVLGAFMLRRTKSLLLASGSLELPPLTEMTFMVPLVTLQKRIYMSILRKELSQLLEFSSGHSNHHSLQNMVMQLRKACSHPYLFPGIEPEPYVEGEHLVQASGKLIVLDQLLRKLSDSGHRVLLFAQMTHTLDILQDFMELRKYSYECLDGSIRAEERFSAIRSFSVKPSEKSDTSPESSVNAFVFLISTRAGGVGLNLVAADTVIFYEQDWNPQVDKQALQRAHRIGQTNHVLSINLVTENTIENVMLQRARRKLQLSHSVVGEDHDIEKDMELEGSNLRSIILGLHVFDFVDIDDETESNLNFSELVTIVDYVVSLRDGVLTGEEKRRLDISPLVLQYGSTLDAKESSVNFEDGFDEESYLSWIEKFKEVAEQGCDIPPIQEKVPLYGKRSLLPTERGKKAEEDKFAKWEAAGYHSFSLKEPDIKVNPDITDSSGSVHFVYGDCTQPSRVCPSEPCVIFICVDDSGNWGGGRMFDAVANLSLAVPEAYKKASEFKDLHLGDLHFIKIENGDIDETIAANNGKSPSKWVALAVVQSYNKKRKVTRTDISLQDLELCLSKAAFTAANQSASIHMARVGYRSGSDHSKWYAIERMLRKYASLSRVDIYVHYFQRSISTSSV